MLLLSQTKDSKYKTGKSHSKHTELFFLFFFKIFEGLGNSGTTQEIYSLGKHMVILLHTITALSGLYHGKHKENPLQIKYQANHPQVV